MRAALSMSGILLMSAVLHLALLVVVAVPYQRQTAHGETMSVELVPEKDTGNAFKDSPAPSEQQQQLAVAKEEAQPDWSKLQIDPSNRDAVASGAKQQQQQSKPAQQSAPQQQASQQNPPQQASSQPKPQVTQQPPAPQQQAAAPQAAPQPAPPQPMVPQAFPQTMPAQSEIAPELMVDTIEEQGKRIAALMRLPAPDNDSFGSQADTKAKLEVDDIAQFKTRLKSCWKLPAGIPATQQVKLIVRVALRQDGALVSDPTLIEAPASAMGPPLYNAAVTALKGCAPYTMLPVAKYKEWKVLDINFSPDQMAGG